MAKVWFNKERIIGSRIFIFSGFRELAAILDIFVPFLLLMGSFFHLICCADVFGTSLILSFLLFFFDVLHLIVPMHLALSRLEF
jgi:hypothetical protein